MKLINCAIADDEPIAREGIREFIDQVDFLKFKGFAKDVESTIELLAQSEIDLLFLDINMPGISGIDYVKTLTEKRPLIVFITAYAEFAVESYNLNAVDYLMKPVSFSRFYTAVEKARNAFNQLPKPQQKRDFLFVKNNGRYEKIQLSKIVFIASLQNYIKLHLSSGDAIVMHSTLKRIYEQLDQNNFIMVHKCYIVNVAYITAISGNQIALFNAGILPIGRLFKQNITEIIKNSL